MLRRSIIGSALRIGNNLREFAGYRSGSSAARPSRGASQTSTYAQSISGWFRNSGIPKPISSNLGVLRLPEINPLLNALSFRSSIHSGRLTEDEAGRIPLSLDYGQGFSQQRGVSGLNGRLPLLDQSQVESDADIVHIKLMRNNAFVTLTDSKGNKKIGTSAGKLTGGKLTRYAGETAAEDIGRRLRQMKTRSVVVKVNGHCVFKRKKEAILALKDGYSHSLGNKNPVVYLEDTTRKPHNGCRLPKKRRI